MTTFAHAVLRLVLIGAVLLVFGFFNTAHAAGVVTLTFDDGNPSQYDIPSKILTSSGQTATFYVNSGLLGGGWFMTWAQVLDLHKRGFEIAGHTLQHLELPTLSSTNQNTQVNLDYANFAAKGIIPTNFASPFGAYDNPSLAVISKRYNSHRAFANQGLNYWPYNKYILYVRYITNQTSVEQVKQWVEEAEAQDAWLILVFHEILPEVDPTDDYSWETTKFQSFITYLNSKGIKAKTVKDVLAQFKPTNPNPSFESGMTSWTTDRPTNVLIDTTSKGSHPNPKNSIRMVGSTNPAHLFGPKMPVTFGKTYGMRAYTDSQALNGGEVGFYLDEYDAAGNWISGKWLGGFDNKNVVDKSFVYTPTSANVATMAMQIYMTAGTSGSVIIDNVEFFPR